MEQTFKPYYELTEEVYRGEEYLEYTYTVSDDNLAVAREKAFSLLVDRMESLDKLADEVYERDLDTEDVLKWWDPAAILAENGYSNNGSAGNAVHEFVESDNVCWKLDLVTGTGSEDRFYIYNSNLPLFGLLSGTIEEGAFVTKHSRVINAVEQQ